MHAWALWQHFEALWNTLVSKKLCSTLEQLLGKRESCSRLLSTQTDWRRAFSLVRFKKNICNYSPKILRGEVFIIDLGTSLDVDGEVSHDSFVSYNGDGRHGQSQQIMLLSMVTKPILLMKGPKLTLSSTMCLLEVSAVLLIHRCARSKIRCNVFGLSV